MLLDVSLSVGNSPLVSDDRTVSVDAERHLVAKCPQLFFHGATSNYLPLLIPEHFYGYSTGWSVFICYRPHSDHLHFLKTTNGSFHTTKRKTCWNDQAAITTNNDQKRKLFHHRQTLKSRLPPKAPLLLSTKTHLEGTSAKEPAGPSRRNSRHRRSVRRPAHLAHATKPAAVVDERTC